MPDYAGPLQHLVLSRTLWIIVTPPLVGLFWHVLGALRSVPITLRLSRRIGVTSVALASAATVAQIVVLIRAPRGSRAMLEHVVYGAQLGQLDVGLDLWFDPLSAVACAVACVVATGAAAMVGSRPPAERGWVVWAWLELALAGALLSFLAAGLATTLVGWTLAAAAGAWLAGWTDVRAGVVTATRSAFGIATVLLGASLLFWGLGGGWEGDDYVRDTQPRYAAVRVGGWSEEGQKPQGEETSANESASLTLTSAPGALVYLDDARTVAMRAPFVGAPLSAGPHTFRLHLGDASNDHHIGPVATEAGDEIVLMPLGPTLSYAEMAAALVVRDRGGELMAGRALQVGKAPAGFALMALALGALLLGASAMSAGAPPSGGPFALAAVAQGVTTAAIGPFLLLRVAFLLPLAPRMGMLIAGVGALSLAASAKRALSLKGAPSRWIALMAGAPAGLTLISLSTDGPRKAAFVLVVAGTVTSGVLLTAASRADFAGDRGTGPGFSQVLFEELPERLGELLVSFDRWVVDGVAEAAAALMRITVWVAATSDVHVLSAPADGIAVRATRLGRGLGPLVGGSFARIAWALVALLAAAVVAHALWRRG